jgi:hypothetical protein
MRYALLICSDERYLESQTPAQNEQTLAEYGTWMQEMSERGALQGGERLRPVAEAKTVRIQAGGVVATDGPFAETKEQLGGFYLVDAKDLDDAIDMASRIPAARHGSVEVRPIWEM